MSRFLILLISATLACADSSNSPLDSTAPAGSSDANSPTGKESSNPGPTATTPEEFDRGAGNVILERPAHESAVDTNPVTISGRARTFENHVGIRLEDERGNLMKETYATATGELGEFNPFSRQVFVTSWPGERMRVTIFESSAKDGSIRSRDTALVRMAAPRRMMQLHFPNQRTAAGDCMEVRPIVRALPVSVSAARLAVEALIEGPTPAERAAGFTGPFPEGSAVRSVNLRDGVLTVDLNERLVNVGGSCRVQAIRASLETTLRGIENVDRVVITAMGSEGQALQP